MGLLNIIRKIKKSAKELRILVLGLDNAGKTTILKALSNEDINQIAPTHGFNIKNLQHEGFKLNVWDVGGQEKLREYWSNFFENTDALVFVIDSSDQLRLDEGGAELAKLLSVKDFKLFKEAELKKVPLLVFANKQDLVQALPADEISDSLKLSKITERQWSIVACSAKTQEGLQEGMEWLIKTVQEQQK